MSIDDQGKTSEYPDIYKQIVEIRRIIDPYKNKSNQKRTEDGKHLIFISYNHKDCQTGIDFLDELTVHLKGLKYELAIKVWSDNDLKIGDIFKTEIIKIIAESTAVFLLISPRFLASDFIKQIELPNIYQCAQEKKTQLFPLYIDHCRLNRSLQFQDEHKDSDLSYLREFQTYPPYDKPLRSLPETERNRYYDKAMQDLETVIEGISDKSAVFIE